MVQLLPGENAVIDIPLSSLISLEDAGFQDADMYSRELDQEHVSHLMEVDAGDLPAIETVKVHLAGGNVAYAVIDGYHRWDAHEQLDAATIRGIARTYQNEAQVIDAAFQANLKHGKHASTKTRSQYAVWLFVNDPNEPSMSDIARKVGLNVSSVSRAINRAAKEHQEAQAIEAKGGNVQEVTHAKKLIIALHTFFDNERSFLGAFGNGTGKRDAGARAKAIAIYVQTLPAEKQRETVLALRSVVEALQVFDEKYVTSAPAKAGGKK